MIFNTQFGVKLCEPFPVWRPDDPTILPVCSLCGGDIKTRTPYGCAVSGNAVLCAPCCAPYKKVK